MKPCFRRSFRVKGMFVPLTQLVLQLIKNSFANKLGNTTKTKIKTKLMTALTVQNICQKCDCDWETIENDY